MRAGFSAIQQTLTPAAAGVLNQSIAEAGRRNHGQTTPLHVAATLLASPSGFLRQACIRSHPNSSHPLQCRALELCFSVALERLATAAAQNAASEPGTEPPVSNALMAALKRAQANQRRGCPEQPQPPPLLAVKVELDQLIISILDDPGVSRVMREAGFSSPAVKAAIEQSSTKPTSHGNTTPFLLKQPANANTPSFLLNQSPAIPWAKLQQKENPRDEIERVKEIMLRIKKRNPILVGDSGTEVVMKDFLKKVDDKQIGMLRNVQVITMETGMLTCKNQAAEKISELGGLIEGMMGNIGGVILDLGDLKWLVEEQPEMRQAAVAEMAKLLARFRREGGGEDNRLWFVGTASCETYLRCQVYHSTMETDWDLQAVPVVSRSPLPGMFPRLGMERLMGSPMEPVHWMKAVSPPSTRHVSDIPDSGWGASLCPQCSENYEREVVKLTAIEKLFCEATAASLPQWLRNAKLNDDRSQRKDNGVLPKEKSQELRKKWRDTCLHHHPNFHQNSRCDRSPSPLLFMTTSNDPNLPTPVMFPPKLSAAKPLGQALKLNMDQVMPQQTVKGSSPPGSPVRTDLVLGRKETCDKFCNAFNVDTYKKLVKDLMERVWWQAEAASAVASAVTRWESGNGKCQGSGSRGDLWLLLTGPDRVGKKKMVSVLAEHACGASPVIISLGTCRDGEEGHMTVRGKTGIDRIVEAVQRNPFSVIMLEDVDETDVLVHGTIKRAIECGRLSDTRGCEVSLGSAIFILTGDWSTGHYVDGMRLTSIASGNWRLGVVLREKNNKRSASWLKDKEDRPLKPRKELGLSLSLDLSLTAKDEENTDGSHNSSDVTVDHDEELKQQFSIASVPNDLINNVDESIVFKPVNFSFVLREIKKAIALKFSEIMDDNLSLEVEDDVLEKILGGLWNGQTSLGEWTDNVLAPSFDRLKPGLRSREGVGTIVQLVLEPDSSSPGKSKGNGDWLPRSILV